MEIINMVQRIDSPFHLMYKGQENSKTLTRRIVKKKGTTFVMKIYAHEKKEKK